MFLRCKVRRKDGKQHRTGRCITAPGKVSGPRRFYVVIQCTAWSGGGGDR